jgi:creatinine amidohydrolase/Fe(II)-dependent formamide hydrolase-like protein
LTALPWTDIAALDKRDGVVILPIGAIEQHGAHLPVCTDTMQVNAMLDAALAQLPATTRAWRLPVMPYGKSTEHEAFAGTISLSAATLIAVMHDLARSVARAGFRRLAFLNGHGGNVAVIDAAARDIRAQTGLMTFCLHPSLFVDAPFEISADERRFGIHAGEIETSLMLRIAPELVNMPRAIKHIPSFPAATPPFGLFGAAAAIWLTPDWSPNGVFGDATIATADKGAAILDAGSAKLAMLITDISTFEPQFGADAGTAPQDAAS